MPKEFKLPKLTKKRQREMYRRFKRNLPKMQAQLRALEEAKKVSYETLQFHFNI